jgi:hypothetical protein
MINMHDQNFAQLAGHRLLAATMGSFAGQLKEGRGSIKMSVAK